MKHLKKKKESLTTTYVPATQIYIINILYISSDFFLRNQKLCRKNWIALFKDHSNLILFPLPRRSYDPEKLLRYVFDTSFFLNHMCMVP